MGCPPHSPIGYCGKVSDKTRIKEDVLYALFRIGLPSEEQLLATVSSSSVEKALNKARDAKIVGTDFSVKNALEDFEKFSQKTLREIKAPGTLSALDELRQNRAFR